MQILLKTQKSGKTDQFLKLHIFLIFHRKKNLKWLMDTRTQDLHIGND